MTPIRLMKPYLQFEEVEAEFRAVFESGMFTRGQYVEALRQQLVDYTGARHAFLATSATTALWVCLKLLGIGPGDEVIVSDFSFPATANAVEDLGARPVFADVDPVTFNMQPKALEQNLTPRTKAVIFVDAMGNPSGLAEIKAICQHHGLPLIEDAACGMGSAENGLRCGAIADLTCFSFHPRKLISAGEGGAITTDNSTWAEWLEIKLAHGAKGHAGTGLDFIDYGYNFRLPELQAIMVSKQLAKLDSIVDARNRIRQQYIEKLAPHGFVTQHVDSNVRFNVQSLVFRVPEHLDRDAMILALREAGVETTLGTYAMSSGSYFRHKYATPQPNSAALQRTTLTLPCFDGVDVSKVAEVIQDVLR